MLILINVSINGFGYEDETAYRIYTSKQTVNNNLDLLLLSSSKNFNFLLIKDFNKFMTIKQSIVINIFAYHHLFLRSIT